MKKYDFIVWDFNGTILDDVQIGIESINALLTRRGIKTIDTREEYRNSFSFPIIEWYKKLGFDFETEAYSVVANEWVAEYVKREPNATICDGAVELLEWFKNTQKSQVIISASEENMLERQLRALGVHHYFDAVVGKNDVYASGKIETAKKWRDSHPGKILFIGDTDHDLEVAIAIGADCILAASGHQSYERLCKLMPENGLDYRTVRSLRDILKIV